MSRARGAAAWSLWVYLALIGRSAALAPLKPVSLDSADKGFQPMQFQALQAPRAGATYQKIRRVPGGYRVEYGFKNFNNDALKASAGFDEKTVADSIAEFGFKQSDLDALDRWYEEARQNVLDRAQRASFSGKVTAPDQAQLDRKLAEIRSRNERVEQERDSALNSLAQEYRKRRVVFYAQAGFHYVGDRVIEVNIPALVGKNTARLRPMAQSFAAVAQARSYDAEDLVGAVTAMVQTSLRYEDPGLKEGTRTIGGVLPPLKTLILGQGDCDTKSALMAGILKNWPNLRMVGLEIPEHYLMAVHRIPRQGDVYVEYEGLPYVMIEAAGPAWIAPGTVGETTQAYLQGGNNFKIQPL